MSNSYHGWPFDPPPSTDELLLAQKAHLQEREHQGHRNHVIAMFLTVVFLLGAGFAAGFFFGRLDAIDEACAEKPAIIFEICEDR